MKMCELFSFLPQDFTGKVLDLTADTRKIKKGSVFFLLPRAEPKFVEYYQNSTETLAFFHACKEHKDKGLFVENIEEVYSRALKDFYKASVENLKIYGVTGTNGKTTTAFLLQSLLESYGVPSGLYGTVKNGFRDNLLETNLTSPAAEDFYRFNHENYKKGMRAVVCEVSSHALDQKRLGVEFLDGAGFTSFSQDHLDYHGTMETYLEAKVKITAEALKDKGFFVVSKDVRSLKEWSKESLLLGENYNFEIISRTERGSVISFSKAEKDIEGLLPLFGDYNASNFAMALAMLCEHFGDDFFPDERIFKDFVQIPGRMERIELGGGSSVFIDYSHTPDSLEKALETLKHSADGKKIITIFGCGGDRDKGKRPLMGALSEKLSDITIITNDNPRGETPESVIKDILSGISEGGDSPGVSTELSRALAIETGLGYSLKEPCFILIAGKGHEQTQEIMGVKKHFSDREEVLNFIKVNSK